MKKIEKIVLELLPDYDCDLDWLGSFSDDVGEYAVENTQAADRNSYKYFNAANVENMEEAQGNYDEMMKFERGDKCMYGIKAIADIRTSSNGSTWLINKITSGGLWGLESDGRDEDFQEVYDEQLEELRETLIEFGFTTQEVTSAPIEYKE